MLNFFSFLRKMYIWMRWCLIKIIYKKSWSDDNVASFSSSLFFFSFSLYSFSVFYLDKHYLFIWFNEYEFIHGHIANKFFAFLFLLQSLFELKLPLHHLLPLRLLIHLPSHSVISCYNNRIYYCILHLLLLYLIVLHERAALHA